MTPERLAEIEAVHRRYGAEAVGQYVPDLIEEIRRLRAELAQGARYGGQVQRPVPPCEEIVT